MSKALAFVFCLVAIAACAFYEKDSGIINLTKANFQSEVHECNDVVVVEFYATWCGHCKKFKPEYEKLASNLKGVVKVAAVNIDTEKELAGYYKVEGVPTVKIFSPTKTTVENGVTIKVAQPYERHRSAAALQMAVLKDFPDFVERVKPQHAEKFINTPDIGKALLFTLKRDTTALYKSVSIEFKDRLLVGEVAISPEGDPQKVGHELAAKYNVTSYPTLFAFPAPTGDQPVQPVKFTGPIAKETVLEFLEPFAKPDTRKKSAGGAKKTTTTQPAAPVIPTQKKLVEIKDQATLKTECLDRNGTCVFFFLAPELTEEDRPYRRFYNEQMNNLFEVYGNGASPYNFGWIDLGLGEEYDAVRKFAGTFNVLADNLPRMVIMHPHKKRAAEYTGTFEFAPISDWLNKIQQGKKPTYPITKVPKLA